MPLLDFDGLKPIKKVIQTHTQAKAQIYPHKNTSLFSGRSTQPIHFSPDAGQSMGHIVALNYSHILGQSSANFELTVKVPRFGDVDIERGDIADFDWIDLAIIRNGISFPLLRGVIDSVSQDDQSRGGATARTISIAGRSHGALFDTVIAWNNAYIQTYAEIIGGIYLQRTKGRIGGSPSEHFKILFDAAFNSSQNPATSSIWMLPEALQSSVKSRRFGEACKIVADIPSKTQGIYYNTVALWTNPGDNLHGAITEWCNPLLNEFIYDLAPYPDVKNQSYEMQAIIRERPFINSVDKSNSPFFKLPKWSIPEWILGSRNLNRNGQERFTAFDLIAQYQFGNSQYDQHALAPILMNLSDVERYGVKVMSQSTKYYEEDSKKWDVMRFDWMRRLADWYGANPYFLSGSISVKPVLPEIRVGQRVALMDATEKKEYETTYYVEGVTHSLSWPRTGAESVHGETTLRLTRGLKGTIKDQVDKIIKASNMYKEIAIE